MKTLRAAGQGFLIGLCITSLLGLQGCASPAARLDQKAAELGFTRELVEGSEFRHVVYRNQATQPSASLHVYLEGDGSPYFDKRWISRDPTTRHPLMLRLMALDPKPSVYLARPCYNGLASTPPCEPALWTSARYSTRVVNSNVAALRNLIARQKTPTLVLFGHSGGGTLAMLMAEQLPETRAVITIAGNLDTDAWVEHHNYRPLKQSLNPARRAPLSSDVWQLHLVGREDTVVPAELVTAAVQGKPRAQVQVVETFNHMCCWARLWPDILDRTDRVAH
ncbi:MAG: alpha/beta hydrolase [Gammaproteobacteria bacterium]|nr:alpha/beta hydrolase [Gammaproteobacteria bacterium]